MEEYKQCFEAYEISNFGNCRRLLHNGQYKEVKGSILNRGYRYFQTRRRGKRQNYLFHHMVAKCFIGERPEGLVIDHIDRNRLNNNVNNLRYITQRENAMNTDSYRIDIETKDAKERLKILLRERRDRIRDNRLYPCNLCNLTFQGPKKLQRHIDGARHKLKQKYHDEMIKQHIEWTPDNYKKCKDKVNDYNCGKRVSKPTVYFD